jgi:uncharacterized OB-fold protein
MNSINLLDAALALPSARVAGRRGRRCAIHADEDAVTLAAEAVTKLLEQTSANPAALVLATTNPPYEEGGSTQPLVELAGLDPDLFTCELTATSRDGLAAIRLAAGLIAAGTDPVVVVAADLRRPGDAASGDGAVALLLGSAEGPATLSLVGSHVEELRDRWRLPGDAEARESDSSFIAFAGPERLVPLVLGDEQGAAVVAPQQRYAAKAERNAGGSGDTAADHTGLLGAAHPLLRLLLGLEKSGYVVATAGGLVDAVRHEPKEGAAELAARTLAEVEGGMDVKSEPPRPELVGIDMWSSAPRAWRERGQDLRLEGIEVDGRKVYPPPAAVGGATSGTPFRLSRDGTVLTQTVDRVYPLGSETGMAMVDLDDGVRFYGMVIAGEKVEIGNRVRLVPRRMHTGGGVAQYFWKVAPCR